jgi:hypothetical protein
MPVRKTTTHDLGKKLAEAVPAAQGPAALPQGPAAGAGTVWRRSKKGTM